MGSSKSLWIFSKEHLMSSGLYSAGKSPPHLNHFPFCFSVRFFSWDGFWIMCISTTSCIWRVSGENFKCEIYQVQNTPHPPISNPLTVHSILPWKVFPCVCQAGPPSALPSDSKRGREWGTCCQSMDPSPMETWTSPLVLSSELQLPHL